MPDYHSTNPISAFLEPGERVTWWQERPRLRFSAAALIPVAFSITWTLVTFTSFVLTLTAMFQDVPGAFWMKPAASLFLTAVGIGMTVYSWRGVRAPAVTSYVITDRAALIIEHGDPARMRRFDRDAVARRVVLSDRIAFVDDLFDPSIHDERSSFTGLEDVAAADRALDRVARKIVKPDDGDDFFYW